jgi:serine/threonine-protein phosphatase 4 regulatory subunit 1
MDGSDPPVNENQDYALRFEDLTVDDDLPLLDRIVRYCRSGIALQRLVHVKMLAETAETVGYVICDLKTVSL